MIRHEAITVDNNPVAREQSFATIKEMPSIIFITKYDALLYASPHDVVPGSGIFDA